jgi:hypothetical protein
MSDPWRLWSAWGWAGALAGARRQAREVAWRQAVDAELARAGVFERMAAANTALGGAEFARRLNAARDARAAARDENDVARVCREILAGMGLDLTDVHIRLRRARESEMPRSLRRSGGAQLRLRATPTVEAAQRAIDAACEAGYPPPGGAAAPLVAETEQAGQGTSTR